jgi:VWFA-related protein
MARHVFFPFLLGFSIVLAASARGQAPAWLDDVDPLITAREREVFLRLTSEGDRQAFIERFWQVRDPYPETARNEARERWEARLTEARRHWPDPRDERARILLVNGEPGSRVETRCDGERVEAWIYEPRFQVKYRTVLVFTGGESGPARLWHPGDTPDLRMSTGPCAADPKLAELLIWIRLAGRDGYESIAKRALAAPKPREWVSSFKLPSAGSVETARRQRPSLAARLAVDFPGRQGDGVVRVLVEPVALPDDTVHAQSDKRELILTGKVLRGEETVDTFRYRFENLPMASRGAVPVAFERRLRPGVYKLKVELDSPDLGQSFVGERELAVPGTETAPALASPTVPVPPVPAVMASRPAPEVPPEVRRVFEEADAELAASRPGLRIVAPGDTLLAGVQQFEVRVDRAAGVPDEEQIERVSFALDGKTVLARTRPPYVAQLDLGKTPRPHRLAVEGLSRSGAVLATDEVVVNGGAQRLAVKLLEPRPGRIYRRSVRPLVRVDAPEDRPVERVELYLGDTRVATLYQPPYAQPLVLSDDAQTGYVRAVAYLADGTSAEDLVLLNVQAAAVEKMDVRFVELYANVVDGGGRPVPGLGAGDLQVFEDGQRQSVRLVERVDNTPLKLVTLIDNSASMQSRMDATEQAASQFLSRALKPGDQAAVITFNRAPRVAVGLTGDLSVLEEGLSGLIAEEETSLYDSLIFSLYYLGGAPGQRAVLLLSDGLDRTSGFRFEDALECARRAGIAVYTIGLDLPKGEAAQRLAKLAAETGGRSFLLQGAVELDRAYAEIEHDLRSRYRISYQSSNTRSDDKFRTVRVQVGKPGLEARTISGYYP